MINQAYPTKEFSLWARLLGVTNFLIIIFNIYITNKDINSLIQLAGTEIRPMYHFHFLVTLVLSAISLLAYVLMHILSFVGNKKIVLCSTTLIVWLIIIASISSECYSFITVSNVIQKNQIRIAP